MNEFIIILSAIISVLASTITIYEIVFFACKKKKHEKELMISIVKSAQMKSIEDEREVEVRFKELKDFPRIKSDRPIVSSIRGSTRMYLGKFKTEEDLEAYRKKVEEMRIIV